LCRFFCVCVWFLFYCFCVCFACVVFSRFLLFLRYLVSRPIRLFSPVCLCFFECVCLFVVVCVFVCLCVGAHACMRVCVCVFEKGGYSFFTCVMISCLCQQARVSILLHLCSSTYQPKQVQLALAS